MGAPGVQTVLVVDDEPSVVRFLRVLLEGEGYEVYQAMSGPLALGLIPAINPGVAVVDVMMPGMDGVELCSRIRDQHPSLPVIILTARDDRDLEDRCMAAGASYFLTKPLLPGQLATVLQSLPPALEQPGEESTP
jgi:CheY-like chemotaxis protein